MQRVFTTNNVYGAGIPNYETVMFQAGTETRKTQTFNKIWLAKAQGSASIQYKPMVRHSSALYIVQNNNIAVYVLQIEQQYNVSGRGGTDMGKESRA